MSHLMEVSNQQLVPFNVNYEPAYLKSEDSSLSLRPVCRQPLSDLVGNAQPQTLASSNCYDDGYKGDQSSYHQTLYSIPTLPSQPQYNNVERQHINHRHRHRPRRDEKRRAAQPRIARNPIVDSPQYAAYRSRQIRGKPKKDKETGEIVPDSKWPDILEDAFLDALIYMPQMQRCKYSFNGKPHGRNELITKWLWFAYRDSVPYGEPREDMRRDRKQVSSHIQVLKGFLTNHPAKHILFPPATKKSGQPAQTQDFKNNLVLKGLTEGRLPNRNYPTRRPEIKPANFTLNLTADDDGPRSIQGQRKVHNFAQLLRHPNNPMSLESVRDWRERFPDLHHYQLSNSRMCPIVHMNVALSLLQSPPPPDTHLEGRTKIHIPTTPDSHNLTWQSVTTLNLPQELYSNMSYAERLKYPPINQEVLPAQAELTEKDRETIVSVRFPVAQFAYAFTELVKLVERHVAQYGPYDAKKDSPAHPYVEKITLYQEVQSQVAPGMPFITRAILLWEFREGNMSASSNTTWGYLDAAPPRRSVMSPSPGRVHQALNMHDRWAEPPMMIQSNMMDSYSHGHGLVTPPHTAGLQSPYDPEVAYSFSQQQSQQPYDMQHENMSFVSNNTMGSDTTLVDDATAANFGSFLSNTNANLVDDEHHQRNWQQPMPPIDSFDNDPSWMTNNYAVPTSTPVMGSYVNQQQHVVQSWPETLQQNTKLSSWDDETTPKEMDHGHGNELAWNPQSLVHKLEQNFEQTGTMEQRHMPWIEERHEYTHAYEAALTPEEAEMVEAEMGIEITMGDVLDIQIETRQETMENTLIGSPNLESHHTLDTRSIDQALVEHMEHTLEHIDDHHSMDTHSVDHTLEHALESIESQVDHTDNHMEHIEGHMEHTIEHSMEGQIDHDHAHAHNHTHAHDQSHNQIKEEDWHSHTLVASDHDDNDQDILRLCEFGGAT